MVVTASPPDTHATFTSVVATLGAAAGVGAFIALVYPSAVGTAVWVTIVVALIGLGVLSVL